MERNVSKFFKAINAINAQPSLEILHNIHLEQMIIRPSSNREFANFKKENRFSDFNFTQFSDRACTDCVSCHRISVKRYKSVNASIINIQGKPEIVLDTMILKSMHERSYEIPSGEYFFFHFTKTLSIFGITEVCRISLKLYHGANHV